MKVALDTETGGLNAAANPILSLAIWSPELEETQAGPFMARIAAGTDLACEQRALEVNKLDPAIGMSRHAAARMLLEWWTAQGKPRFKLIGHNVGPFDVPFVQQLRCCGVDLPWGMMFDYHYRDTATLALAFTDLGILSGKLSLGGLCSQLGIEFQAHDALQDTKAAWHAWNRMTQMLKDTDELLARMRRDLPALEVYANDGRYWVAPYGWPVIDLGRA